MIDHKELTDFQERLRGILIESNGKYDDNTVIRLSGQVFELVEQWSEEDECCINQLIIFCENCMVQDSNAKKCANWLKSLKERVGCEADCTTTKEWREDDSRLKEVLYYIEYINRTNVTFQQRNLTHLINWLKSLKERYTWRPTDEQMEVLVWCKPLFVDPKSKGILESLINDLKKLREE